MKRHTSLRTYAHMIEGAIGAVMLALYGLSNLPVPDTHVDTQQQVEQQQQQVTRTYNDGLQPAADYALSDTLKGCYWAVEAHNAQHAVKLIDYDVYATDDQQYTDGTVSVIYVYQNKYDYYNSFAVEYTCDSNGITDATDIGLNEVN